MFLPLVGTRRRAALGALLVAAGASGCAAKLTRKDFDSEVAKIREELQVGDQQLGNRLDMTNKTVSDHERRLAAVEQELQAFQSDFNVSMERLEGVLTFNVPVHFDFGSAAMREADRPVLDRFTSVVLEHYPYAVITVEGFADPAGSSRFNKELAQRRAEAVRAYLAASGGFPDEQLKAVSYGEAANRQVVPGAMGPGEKGLPNRRVALVIEAPRGAATAEEMTAAP